MRLVRLGYHHRVAPLDQVTKAPLHVFDGEVNAMAVAGQHPLKTNIGKFGDGRIQEILVPDQLARRLQSLCHRVPPEMIPGEKEPIHICQRLAPSGMARHVDDLESRRDPESIPHIHDPLGVRHGLRIGSVDYPG